MKNFQGITLSLLLVAGICRAFAAETPPPEPQGSVRHVVVVWLKEPGSRTARDRYLELSRSLARLPGVMSYHVGLPIPSARSVVDSSYDVAVVAVFKDKQALEAYNANADRQQVIEAMRPLVQKVVVYDFAD